MKVTVLGVDPAPDEVLDLTPQHKRDFCDRCGACLSCFGGDGDCAGEDRAHVWVVYPGDAAAFRDRMGLGVGTPDTGDDLR